MNLQFAVVLSDPVQLGGQPASRVKYLHRETVETALYSLSMQNYHIFGAPGDLVAVEERAEESARIIFRWSRMRIKQIEGGLVFTDLPHELENGLRLAQDLSFVPAPGEWIFAANGEVVDACVDGLPANPGFIQRMYFPQIQAMYRQADLWDSLDPRQVVADGYDRIVSAYQEWSQSIQDGGRERYTVWLLDSLSPGSRVLELGCGGDNTTTQRLAQRFVVTGLDISERQIEAARQNVPGAEFLVGDMSRVEFPPGRFDAVAAFYSIIHLPREEFAPLFAKIHTWLRPGGFFVANLGSRAVERDFDEDFLGARMFWSSYDPPEHRRLVEAAGFDVQSDQLETQLESGQLVTFQWLIAQKPA